jgi:hypothetical protein
MKKLSYISACLIAISLNLSVPHANAANLGLTLQILQGESSKSGVENNTRLWFVIEPGTSKSRKIIVRNTSGSPESVSISIGAVKRVNGESQLAVGEVSETEKWANFTDQDFLLAPRSEKVVTVGFTIPKSESVNSYSAMLLVKATSPQNLSNNLDYSVPGAAQIAAPIFLGIGTEDEFVTSFEIKGVEGQNTVQGKSIRVEIENSGKTPISIQGDVQATGITFKTSTLGPFAYQTETIAPGESKFADALVGESIAESKWRIYVTAVQGQVTESREFEVDIRYSETSNLSIQILKFAVPILFLLLLYWSITVLKSSRRKQQGIEPTVEKSTARRGLPDLSDYEIEQLLAEFKAKSGKRIASKKPVAKTTAKKSVAKKVAKKVPPKKAVTKKAAKKSAQTKLVSKTPVKKVVKKK